MSVSIFDSLTLTVEAALSAATDSYGEWDEGLWDTATWGPDIVWVDISAYVRSIQTNRQFSRDLQAWESGTATIVLNNRDGRFSPDNLSGPYVSSGVTSVRPLRPIRVRVTCDGTTYSLFTGYALAWQDAWTIAATNAGDAITVVPCVDELARLSAYDGYEQSPVGSGETSGERIHRILNNAGHTGERNIEEGIFTVQETTLAANATTELKLTTDSEGGGLYIDDDGTVVFQGQYALVQNTRSIEVQATFGDGGGDEIPYSDLTAAYDGDLTCNIVSYAREGGSEQTVADSTSRALYGDIRNTRTDLICETDAQVLQLASWYLARYKAPELRFTSIEIKPRRDPTTLYPQVLGRKVRDLVEVTRRPPGSLTITRDCFISGVSHTITPDPQDWTTRFSLWSASPYTAFSDSLWDTGLWDSALWFY